MMHFLSHSNCLRHQPRQTPARSPLCPPAKATLNLGTTKRKCKLWGCQGLNPTWRAHTTYKMAQEAVSVTPGLSKCQEAGLCAKGGSQHGYPMQQPGVLCLVLLTKSEKKWTEWGSERSHNDWINHDLLWKAPESPSTLFSEVELSAGLITIHTCRDREETLGRKRLIILAAK